MCNWWLPRGCTGELGTLPSWSCPFLWEPQAHLRMESRSFSFRGSSRWDRRSKPCLTQERNSKEEGKFVILSCAWPLPDTSLPWGLILSCKRAASIMEIKLGMGWFLPGAVIYFRLLKNPSGQLCRVGNSNNKRISEEIWTVSRLAYFSNNNFQFKRVLTTYFSTFALSIYCAYTPHNSWWLICKNSYLI